MKKIGSTILTGLLAFHLIGSVVSTSYFEWMYHKENSFINSMVFGLPISVGKSLIWEYYGFKTLMNKNNNVKGEILFHLPIDTLNNSAMLVDEGEAMVVNIYRDKELFASARDVNKDKKLDECFEFLNREKTKCAAPLFEKMEGYYDAWNVGALQVIGALIMKADTPLKQALEKVDDNVMVGLTIMIKVRGLGLTKSQRDILIDRIEKIGGLPDEKKEVLKKSVLTLPNRDNSQYGAKK